MSKEQEQIDLLTHEKYFYIISGTDDDEESENYIGNYMPHMIEICNPKIVDLQKKVLESETIRDCISRISFQDKNNFIKNDSWNDWDSALEIESAFAYRLNHSELNILEKVLEHNKKVEISRAKVSQSILLKYLRRRGMQLQKDAAKLVHVATRTWERYESEEIKCPKAIIHLFCELCNINFSALNLV